MFFYEIYYSSYVVSNEIPFYYIDKAIQSKIIKKRKQG